MALLALIAFLLAGSALTVLAAGPSREQRRELPLAIRAILVGVPGRRQPSRSRPVRPDSRKQSETSPMNHG
jgi:hypothetical protein